MSTNLLKRTAQSTTLCDRSEFRVHETVGLWTTFISLASSPSYVFSAHDLLAALILNIYIVQRDEVTPGITLNEYKKRRSRLMQALPDSSMVVSVAAPVKYMSGGM